MKRLLPLVLLALPGWAQPPQGFFPWWDSPVAKELNLTDLQRRQIQDTVREFRDRMIDLRAAVEKAEGQVEELFNEDPVDVRRTGDAIDKLVAARGELMKAMSHMNLRLRAVLTGPQWRELQKRQRRPGPPGMRDGRPPLESPRHGPRGSRPRPPEE